MTKNVSHVSQRIVCPRCGTRNLRKSLSPKNGKEYFCDRDHEYFGIAELVNKWNFDAADFYGTDGTTQLDSLSDFFKVEFWTGHRNSKAENTILVQTKDLPKYISFFLDPEGEWSSKTARDESYEVVNNILMGVEEWEDCFDPRDLPCPILQTGVC